MGAIFSRLHGCAGPLVWLELEKLDRLGGAQWIRDRIDRAKEVK
jgi:hypothetical protein